MKSQIVFVAVCLAGLAGAEVSGDRPDARHAWAVHDMFRPNPPAVKTVEGQPPSDAIRLFDGTAESFAKNWRSANGKPARWQVKDGVLVQDHWPLENGETTWCRRTKFRKMPSAGPVMLQDHGDPISFRNVWIRRIPSPYDNTTCGGPGVKEDDVAALRAKLAADARKTAESASDLADRMLYYWISLGYQESASVRAKAEAATAAYTAAIRTWNHEACLKARERLATMDRFTSMLKNSGLIPATSPVLNEIRSALKR